MAALNPEGSHLRSIGGSRPSHAAGGLPAGGGGGTTDDMIEAKLARLERRLEGIEGDQRTHFRWTLGTLFAVVSSFFALASLVLVSTTILLGRIDRIDDKLARVDERVTEMPGKMTQGMLEVNRTLSDAITAAKQQPAQVILLPAPSPTQTPAPPRQ